MPINNVMIDIETIATQPDAMIVSIAAVKFDPFADYLETGVDVSKLPQLNLLVDPESQPNRVIDPVTLNWWAEQDPAVQESIFGADLPRVSLTSALEQLHNFCWQRVDRIWVQGPQFDISILEHAYRSIGRAYPWQYWVVRDSRTLLDFVPVILPAATHDAMADCFRQITGVQKALGALGITRFCR